MNTPNSNEPFLTFKLDDGETLLLRRSSIQCAKYADADLEGGLIAGLTIYEILPDNSLDTHTLEGDDATAAFQLLLKQ